MPDKNGTMPGQPGYMTPEEEAKYAVDPSTDVGAPKGKGVVAKAGGRQLWIDQTNAGQTSQDDTTTNAINSLDPKKARPFILDKDGNRQEVYGNWIDANQAASGQDYVDKDTGVRYIAKHSTTGNINEKDSFLGTGIGGGYEYVDPRTAAGKAEIENRAAASRGETDAYVDPRAKVAKQVTLEMQAALQKQKEESLGKFNNNQTPLDVTRANLANAQQQALLNQLQASRKQGSIAQLQGATAFGRNIAQAGVGAGRGALASRAALGNLARGQSNVAGAVGTGAGKEQAAISGALAQQLAGMRGSNLATNQAANQALLQQKQNALGNYTARSGALASGEQARKNQEIQNLLRAYRMEGLSDQQRLDLQRMVMGSVGSGASTIASALK